MPQTQKSQQNRGFFHNIWAWKAALALKNLNGGRAARAIFLSRKTPPGAFATGLASSFAAATRRMRATMAPRRRRAWHQPIDIKRFIAFSGSGIAAPQKKKHAKTQPLRAFLCCDPDYRR
jgi:hypothetical protein